MTSRSWSCSREGRPADELGGAVRRHLAPPADFEAAGLDWVFVPEAYTFDSVSRLGAVAVSTSTVEMATGIMNVYSRTPGLIAMTAAGLDAVSGGRFILGLGTSGPQVIEGFHAVPYAAPSRGPGR